MTDLETTPIAPERAPAVCERRAILLLGERVKPYFLDSFGAIVIGRDPEADLVIDHKSVSRRHAIVHVGVEVTIEDTGSVNGVFVDGERLASGAKRAWRPREAVLLGEASLVLLGGATSLQPSPAKGRAAASDAPRPRADRIVRDPTMVRLDALARSIAPGELSVLLMGETGTGKDVFADTIHHASPRAEAPFVSLNCAALSAALLESELFGHERGAFTGALHGKLGLLEAANGGTVFLDEIGELPLALQAKLLHVLERRSVTRVGGVRPRPLDVRFVSATNRDLEMDVAEGRFRRDLYYRINGASILIPPLRDRPSEIEPLVRHFLGQAARQAGRVARPEISRDALDALAQHAWPGNIRELRNAVERAFLLSHGETILREHLPPPTSQRHLTHAAPAITALGDAAANDGVPDEVARIVDALSRCAGNQTRAARLLGIARSTLALRLAEYNLPRPKMPPPIPDDEAPRSGLFLNRRGRIA